MVVHNIGMVPILLFVIVNNRLYTEYKYLDSDKANAVKPVPYVTT